MAGYSSPNGRGRLGFRVRGNAEDGAETKDGWGNSTYPRRAEVNQHRVGCDDRGVPGVIDSPRNREDGTITSGFPNKGGNHQSDTHHATRSDGGRTGFPGGIFQRQKFDYGDYEGGANVSTEPPLITTGTGRWTGLSHTGWAMPPEATDTGTAAEHLQESARPSPGAMAGAGRRNSALPNTYQPKKRDSVTATIDSTEAAKKYGGMFV